MEKWNPSDEDDDGYSATCAANDIKLFNKYAYIKLNRAYIPSEERYYYFPDPDVYGSDACYDSSSSSLVFNLYEAKIYEGIMSIPLYPKMTDADVIDSITAVKKIVNYYRK